MRGRDYQRLSVWVISTLSVAAFAGAQPPATPSVPAEVPLACERWFADADVKLKQGQAADALALYELAAKECPDNPRVQLRIAMSAQQAGKKGQAGEALRHFLELKPEAASEREVKELAKIIGEMSPVLPEPPSKGEPAWSNSLSTQDRAYRLALGSAAEALDEYAKARGGGGIEFKREVQAAISSMFIARDGKLDRRGCELVGVAADSLDDNPLAAIAFASIEHIAPDYLNDPTLGRIMVNLNRRPIQSSVVAQRTTAARFEATRDWVGHNLKPKEIADQLRIAAEGSEASTIRRLLSWISPSDAINLAKSYENIPAFLNALRNAGLDVTSLTLADMAGMFEYGISGQDVELLRALLAAGVNPDSWHRERGGLLYYVCASDIRAWRQDAEQGGRVAEIARLLLRAGANKGHLTGTGGSALLGGAIIVQRNPELVDVLLSAGLSANKPIHKGQAALHLCIVRRSGDALGIIRTLLRHGADPNTIDDDGNTPLHLIAIELTHWGGARQAADAIIAGDDGKDWYRKLVDAGDALLASDSIRPNIRNSFGNTPLDILMDSKGGPSRAESSKAADDARWAIEQARRKWRELGLKLGKQP